VQILDIAFLRPPLWGLAKDNVPCSSGLIGKRVVDFLLVLIELSFLLGVKAEALRMKIDRKSAISLQCGWFDPKFQAEWVATTNHSSCYKTRVNGLFLWYKNAGKNFLSFCHKSHVCGI